MHLKRLFKWMPGWVAIALLIAAEAFAVVHAADLDAHSGGESCKFCLYVSQLDTAAAPAALPRLVPAGLVEATPFEALPSGDVRRRRPAARGPPQAA